MESDESDGSFPPWVSLEYSQMLLLAAPSPVIFSSLSPASVDSLKDLLEKKGAKEGSYRNETRSVGELMQAEGVRLERVCLLDPRAEKEIGIEDRESFDWFLCVVHLSQSVTSLTLATTGSEEFWEMILLAVRLPSSPVSSLH